ncbi:HEAT repeat domain-containing protein [Nannocystis pusilla]|uniref:HEAT repeat domain-containing protein n=1 Tax=Nannocystis pusilla TaxID=889268 RepID=A0ABS7U1W4_9BACT|nr:HEAT repeat domain-containing protein [Nannocystis pusilla]MBZ5714524.1 HEAT repeat domain-containing protein [Nannocystis pusilla]
MTRYLCSAALWCALAAVSLFTLRVAAATEVEVAIADLAALDPSDSHKRGEVALAALLRVIERDDEARTQVLAEFAATEDDALRGRLAVALGLVDDPRVEAVALRMARPHEPLARRLAALDLLDRRDSVDPEIVGGIAELLAGDEPPAVHARALYALGRPQDDPALVRRVLAAVRPHALGPGGELRARALWVTAQWARAEPDLAPVLAALGHEDWRLRAAACFALGQARLHTAAAEAALVARMTAEDERPAVRDRAWRSLRRQPVREDTRQRVQAFRRAAP